MLADFQLHPIALPEDQYVKLCAAAAKAGKAPHELLEQILLRGVPPVITPREALAVACRCCQGPCKRPFRWRDRVRCGCGQ